MLIITYRETRADVSCLKDNIVRQLKNLLDEHNPHVKAFRQVRIVEDGGEKFKLLLIDGRASDGTTHNLPTADEVAALIPVDFVMNMEKSEIILQIKTGRFHRISKLHPSYFPLQYPLLFLYGEDGFRLDISIGYEDTRGRKHKSITFQSFLRIEFLRGMVNRQPKPDQGCYSNSFLSTDTQWLNQIVCLTFGSIRRNFIVTTIKASKGPQGWCGNSKWARYKNLYAIKFYRRTTVYASSLPWCNGYM